MKGSAKTKRDGFALVLTLALLALLVLAVFGMSALVRVDSQIATASAHQTKARQNALLGLELAMGRLQVLAGPDDRVTAMAGIAGEAGGSQRRHWCGVWDGGGRWLGWLTSGALESATPDLGASEVVQLVERNTVGVKPATANAYVDEEYVDAGKVRIVAPGAAGSATVHGAYAFWVGDEGAKVSAHAPAATLPSGGMLIRIASTPTNVARIGAAFQQFDTANAPKVIVYEQATNLFHAAGGRLSAASLHDGFHHVTVSHRSWPPDGGYQVGQVNLNTTSAVVWRSLIESYEAAAGATPFGSAAKRTSAINAIANGLAASDSGKAANTPFLSVEAFLHSSLLSAAVSGKNGIPVTQFAEVMAPMLVVRSDTFRVRAYGEAVDPFDPSRVKARAWCEAILQRTPAPAGANLGRKFVVSYFRWLGPDDL